VLTRVLSQSASVAEQFEKVYPRIEHLIGTDPPRYDFRYISVAVRLSRR
jgi:hypothetical protein